MDNESVLPELVIDGTSQNLVVTRHGEVVFRGPLDHLTALSSRPAWLVLHGGEHISIPMPGAATALLGEFAPSEELRLVLDELQEEQPYCDEGPEEQTPLRADIVVNGQPWGWVRLDPTDRWQLLPGDFPKKATTVLRISLWQSDSMTGVVTETAVRWARPVAILWDWDDVDGPKYFSISYDTEDIWSVVDDCVDIAFATWAPAVGCPNCDEDDNGWVLAVDTSEPLGADFAGSVIAQLWKPCSRHAATADQWTVEVSDQHWRWSGDTWVRVDAPDADQPSAGASE